ncbi:MAG: SAVED domain-containing protein [Armatimonadetes bacterium]|nr:SAVED domain-containing protein [Armatimonadota bacterium]
MANQVIARLKGDDYQHLYAWWLALELKMPQRMVRRVCIEDAEAGSMDDVTIEYEPETLKPSRFYQIKYHVDQRNQYSSDVLMARTRERSSLLQKFWRSWKLLRDSKPGPIELYLVSNWTWDRHDMFFTACVDENGGIKASFFEHKEHSEVHGNWLSHLDAGPDELREFAGCIRFKIGSTGADDLRDLVAERMCSLGLRPDEDALLLAVSIVREWIKASKKDMYLHDLDELVRKHDLLLPQGQEPCITVHLNTIVREKYELEPDYVIDWCDYFEGSAAAKGRQLQPQYDWNEHLLPELERLKCELGASTSMRLIRVRGKARLSAWFAFGHMFRDAAGYTLEVDQNGVLWRTSDRKADGFRVIVSDQGSNFDGEIIDGSGTTVAVGISVTGTIDDAVREHLHERSEEIAALLLLRPERELGRDCIRSTGDLVALADEAKDMVRAFVRRWRATKLLLYYFGPLSGACFLGHRFNAVCQEIQLMEDQQPSYSPSFMLR